MPVTVIVGGQFGSEGKGKVAHFLAIENKARVAVRVGGSNSGHTVINSLGFPMIFQHLPTAAIHPDVFCALGAGSYIDLDILVNEISRVRLTSERLIIDPNAMLSSINDVREEQLSSLQKDIGSTSSGTGAAIRRRISRNKSVRLAKDEEKLRQFVQPVIPFLRKCLAEGERVIVEGTQGFGLSLLHSQYYPFVTSRDTTAAAFISEVGLSPFDVDDVVLVIRAFPIRVGGNSGPLPNEIDWDTLTHESGSLTPIIEYTSVTKNTRRVANFDPNIVYQAILANQPTRIVLNHLDYIDIACKKTRKTTAKISSFVTAVECSIKRKIDYLGFGPDSLVLNSRNIKPLKNNASSRPKELQK